MKTKPTDTFHRHAVIALLTLAGALLAAPVASRGDTVYVANYFGNTIHKFDLATGADLGTFASTGLNGPSGLVFDSAGNLYAGNYGNNTIEKFTPGGVGSTFASAGLNAPGCLAFDSAGNLYAANFRGNTIEKFTPQGVGSVFANTGLNGPQGLAFDSAGNLYVANYYGDTITKFTPQGVGSVFASSGLNKPWGLAFDSQGNLYVANFWGNNIEKFTPDGVGSIFATVSAMYSSLRCLAFDNAGNLYASDYADTTIHRFTPGGVDSVLARGGMNNPFGIAIQQVPEPSTCALLGLCLPAFLVIRRRKAMANTTDRFDTSPNPAAPGNGAIALLFQAAHPRRVVPEPHCSATNSETL